MPTELSLESVRALLPTRPDDGHKGTFGHLFVIAGSRGLTGAAKLTIQGATRSGVGLVTLGLPHPLGDIAAHALVEATSRRLPATDAETVDHDAIEPALAFSETIDAVTLGPGLSQHPGTIEFVLDFVSQCPVPLVVDADALNAVRERTTILGERTQPTILTPHPGEMARLADSTIDAVMADREGFAKKFAQQSNTVVVLKGHHTVIAAPDGTLAINPTGNHGLAKGGTGDVLAGILGGLLAQGLPPYETACLGTYLHGLAGDLAAQEKSPRGMIARDVINAIPRAWRALEIE